MHPRVLALAVIAVLVGGCAAGAPSGAPTARSSAGPASVAPSAPGPTHAAEPPPAALPTKAPPPVNLATVPARIHVEGSASTSQWIGPSGGTLSATAADGTTYRLDVPAGAVSEPTPIAMTPIDAVDDLGLSGGMAGSVYLQPVGTRFAVPAQLHIASPRTGPAGTRMIGFDVADDGTTIDLVPATDAEGQVTALISHFSSPGVGWGTSDDLMRIARIANPQTADLRVGAYVTSVLANDVPWGVLAVAEDYTDITLLWSALVKDELTDARSDRDLVGALADWHQLVFLINLLARKGDAAAAIADGPRPDAAPFANGIILTIRGIEAQAADLITARLTDAIVGNRDLCRQSHDLGALSNLSFWRKIGEDQVPARADWAGISGGCATIAISTFNPAANLRAGAIDSLELSLVLQFADGTQVPADFQAALRGTGFTFVSTGSSTATAGDVNSAVLTIDVQGTTDQGYQIEAHACWSLAGLVRDLCQVVVRGFGSNATPPASSGGPVDFAKPCMVYAYQGTFTNFTIPSHAQMPGGAQILTPCRGNPAILSGLQMGGMDITQERIAFQIHGDASGFTATELSCPGSGLPNAGCTGNTTIQGGGGSTLSFTLSGTKSGEQYYAFVGQLSGTFPAN